MKLNSNGCQRASCALGVYSKSRVLLFKFQHTLTYLYIYIYIYLLCMGDIILSISLTVIFITFVFFIKHAFVDSI